MKQFLKISLLLFVLAFLFVPNISHAGYVSDICKGINTCETSEIGPFMTGISVECGNTGRCKLDDLMILVSNLGNYVLSLIGALMLGFYVYGGFWYLASHGDSKLVEKGKKAIKTATVGFLIIMFAWLGIHSLYTAFTDEAVPTGKENYATCKGPTSVGQVCGLHSNCDPSGKCKSLCETNGGQCLYNVDTSKSPPAGKVYAQNTCGKSTQTCLISDH